MRRDIDDALSGWPSDPEPGAIMARELRAKDGRTVIQVRQELGVLQMEVEGRPDGARPHGYATYLDFLKSRATRHRRAALRRRAARPKLNPEIDPDDDNGPEPWVMSEEFHAEVDREFVQFYHRRMAWMALQRYDLMMADADHTLGLMDFVGRHCGEPDYVAAHERFRGLVLFQRTQAAAALALERHRPDEAVDVIREGACRIDLHRENWTEDLDDELPDEALAGQLRLLEREVRRSFEVGKTLKEQLDEAVEEEDYELAATLRDKLRAEADPPKRKRGRKGT